MNSLKAAAVAVAISAFGSAAVMAQDTYKNNDTVQHPPAMAPSANPSAAPSSDGTSTGEGGVNSPAGIPADPNTIQNVQPGPSTGTPNDPAAASNPAARAPTSPPGTGSSSP